MQNKHYFFFPIWESQRTMRGGVKPVGPNSQLLPKICFGGSPYVFGIWVFVFGLYLAFGVVYLVFGSFFGISECVIAIWSCVFCNL